MNPMDLFKQFMTMGKDPKQIEQMIYKQNPQMLALANQMKDSGLTPIQFAMQLAKQNNIPIQENALLNMCQQMQSMTPKK
jgi:hypothetical protein